MKKRTKAKKQKLNNLLVLLVLAAVLLIMSTYAWFTANRTVNIDQIDVHVSTSSGLQISANGIDWKTVINSNDLKLASANHDTDALTGGYGNAVNQMSYENAPVSSGLTKNETNANHLNMFYGIVNADMDTSHTDTYGKYMLTTQLQTDTDYKDGGQNGGHYVAFDIFLKSGNDEKELYLTGNVFETNSEGTKVTTEKGIANAARVALVEGGHTTSDAADSAIQALDTQGTIYLWEPNADAHTQRGLENARDLGWSVPTATGTGTYAMVPSYDAVLTNITVPVELSKATNIDNRFKEIKPSWQTAKGEVKNMVMPNYKGDATNALPEGVTKYRIYMWVEGQDIDCENYASGTYLEYNLGFTLDKTSDETVYECQATY